MERNNVTIIGPKPLGRKLYGSIGHLPNSRLGPGDHKVTDGQAKICLQKARDKHDIIIVQEKLDGSNCGVAKVNGTILPLVRAGYLASSSPYKQHKVFAEWVYMNRDRFDFVLRDGERIVGEWLMQAHGTIYRLRHEPFVVFDIMIEATRLPWQRLFDRVAGVFVLPEMVSYGPPISTDEAMGILGPFGGHGAERPEGLVYRVERHGRVDFLAKYVRPDKIDGCYLPEHSGREIFNWTPEWWR